MKPIIALIATLCALSVLAASVMDVVRADGIDTQGLAMDVYAVDMGQLPNNTAFNITERLYFNNSGNSPFNGTLYSWIPPVAQVFSAGCSNPSTMIVRVADPTDRQCFPFSRMELDEEIISFTPFEDGEMLSYFGQNSSLHLNATSENGTSWHTIPINITVGMGNRTRSSTQPGQGLTITANQERMDARLHSISKIPKKILANQTISITNEVPWNQTISLSARGLRMGWTAHFYDNSTEIDNVTLLANETVTLRFVVEVPSYKTVIEIPYLLNLEATGGVRKSVIFKQSFLYNVTEYSLWLFTNKGMVVSPPPRPYIHEEHKYGVLEFDIIVGSPSAGDSLQIIIEWGGEGEELPSWILVAIAVLVIIIITLIIFWRKGKEEVSKEEVIEVPSEREDIEASEVRREEILAALKEAKAAFSAGHLSEAFYEDIRSKYESELEEIERFREDPEILALKEEKQKLLTAIKDIQKKHESGRISEDVYGRLVGDYKKRAIEIMKELDQRKK